MAPASLPLLAELSPEMLESAARRLPGPLLEKLAGYLRSPSNKLPQMQTRRALEALEEAKKAPPKPKQEPQPAKSTPEPAQNGREAAKPG
eukprot:scaffold677724_cov50-Prasinocladus_malaysianus.AAC.1